ncbi:MAG: hypothetical protein AB2L11_05225 [Syntrophobacteraceae bacterium]
MDPERIFTQTDRQGNHIQYVDREKNRTYRRIFGGLAWPQDGKLPGFAVLVGEEQYREQGSTVHTLHALTEIEELDLNKLFGQCRDLLSICSYFYGNYRDAAIVALLNEWNRKERESSRRGLYYIRSAPLLRSEADVKPSIEYGIRRILDRTREDRKKLILDGCPKVQACLANVQDAGTEQYPPLVALAFAVGSLDYQVYRDPSHAGEHGTYNPLYGSDTEGYDPFTGNSRR